MLGYDRATNPPNQLEQWVCFKIHKIVSQTPCDCFSSCRNLRRLRTAMATILLADHDKGFVCHFGLKCASFTGINQGTSGRTPCTPYGNQHFPSVKEANCLASRFLDKISSGII